MYWVNLLACQSFFYKWIDVPYYLQIERFGQLHKCLHNDDSLNIHLSFIWGTEQNWDSAKKNEAPVYYLRKHKKTTLNFFKKDISKCFQKSFKPDQSKLCISNGLKARALQRKMIICLNAFLYKDCKSEMGNIFIQTNTISKWKKVAIPDWRQMKVLSKGFQMTYNFVKFCQDS